MNKQEFIKKVIERFQIAKVDVEYVSEQLETYKNFLQTQNKAINLTRLDKDEIIWSKYFWQSIMVYDKVNFTDVNTLLDVGSGSGIPGLVIKIFFPYIKLTIVESSHKKCEFMKQLVNLLHLDNVEVICQRAEDISKDRQFDLTTAKAVAPLEIILELLLPFTKVHGVCVVPKSKNYLAEVKDLNQELHQLGAKLSFVDSFVEDGCEFNTLYIKKTNKTNPKYPRDYKKIIKGFDYAKK